MGLPKNLDYNWVVARHNDLILFDKSGVEIGAQLWIRVTAPCADVPTAILKCVVNVASSEEEMRSEIERLKAEEEASRK